MLSLYFIAMLGSRVTLLCHRTAAELLESKDFTRIDDSVKTYLTLKHVPVKDDIQIFGTF